MAVREQNLVIASPFKTGFYAGLGFFVASVLMSVFGVLLAVLLGFGTMAGVLLHHANDADSASPTPTSAHHVNAAISARP